MQRLLSEGPFQGNVSQMDYVPEDDSLFQAIHADSQDKKYVVELDAGLHNLHTKEDIRDQ